MIAQATRGRRILPPCFPEGTELAVTHIAAYGEECVLSHEKGWNGALDKLVRHA
jgi:hypothetical protein